MLKIDVELALQVLERTKGLVEASVHDQMPFRIAVDVSTIPTEKMPTDATFLIIEKNFSRRISLMKITLPSGEIVRAVWLLDTDPAGLLLIQAIR